MLMKWASPLILLPALLLASQNAHSQVCRENRNSLNGLGELSTPMQTKIYSLYSHHMDPADQETIQKWLTAQVPQGDFSQLARLILRKHSSILTQKRHELKVMNELHQEKKISWIGIELSQEEVDQFKSQLTEQAHALKKLLVEKGLSVTDSDDMALLIYDSGHYFVAHRPAGSAPLNLIGLEEEAAYEASLTGAAKMAQAREALVEKSAKLKIPKSALSDFDVQVSQILGDNTPKVSKQLKKNQARLVSRMPSSEGRALVANGFKAAQNFVDVSLNRDEKIARRIWAQSQGSGLFIYGRAHQPGVSSNLFKLCRQKI